MVAQLPDTAETEQNRKKSEDASLELSQLLIKINRLKRQYELFQGFLAVLFNSPSANGPIESLIAALQQIVRVWWYSSASMEEQMGHFMKYVFGDYLQSFRCDHCGSRFMISEGVNKGYFNYPIKCPRCHNSSWVGPDDSFLRAMVSEDQLTNIYHAGLMMEENTILRPFKVLPTTPCNICGKPITDWTEDEVKRLAAGLGWGHKDCWETFVGKMKQIALVGKYIPKTEEKSSQQEGGKVDKPTLPTIRLNI